MSASPRPAQTPRDRKAAASYCDSEVAKAAQAAEIVVALLFGQSQESQEIAVARKGGLRA